MKIGIMTFWQAKENYGQILQLYALYSFFKEHGHEPFLIRYDRLQGDKVSLWRYIGGKTKYLFRPRILLSLLKTKIEGHKKIRSSDRGFQQFISQNIDVTDQVYHSLVALQKNPPLADMYVCGSDQIWNQDKDSYSPAFFLDFGADEVLRISYAASFGKKSISENIAHKIKPLLRRFQLVTVREEEGVDICHRIDIDAYRVPDPTMIINMTRYEKLLVDYEVYVNPYVMLYLLGHDTLVPFNDIYNWALCNSFQVRYVASDHRVDEYRKETPTINQWLGMVKHARYMITNSFHGTVFAILFNIPFVTLPLIGAFAPMNGRLFSLLKDYGLESRLLTKDKSIQDVLGQPIDFHYINNKIKTNKEKVISLLNQFIGV